MPEQGVSTEIVQCPADIGIGDLEAHRALAQVHRVVVVDHPGFQAGVVVQIESGLVAHPGAARLRAAVIPGQVRRVGVAWVVLDLFLGQASGQVILGFPVAQVEAGFQAWAEAITDIGGDALAAAAAVLLVTIVLRIGQGHVVVQIAQHLTGADLTLGIAAAAQFIAHLQGRGIMAGMGDVIDGAAQGQSTAVETVGAAQDFGAAQPQRFEQLVRCAARTGQRQAVEHRVDA
ncbi:hypothetical protein D9M71_468620 [compost metagenome]